MLSDCQDLDAYLKSYGELLGAKATDSLAPLHVPGRDPVLPGMESLLRRPFHAQQHVITAIVKAWKRQKSVILAAECGVGKSLCAAAAIHLAAGGRPYRALVMAPDHLSRSDPRSEVRSKWEREIRETCPGTTVHEFRDWQDVLAVATRCATTPPAGAEWYLLGRDASKGDPAWEHGSAARRRIVTEKEQTKALRKKGASLLDCTVKVATCPRCGTVVVDKDKNPVDLADLIARGKKLRCKGEIARWSRDGDGVKVALTPCDEPLWQYTAARTAKQKDARRAKLLAAGARQSHAPFRWAPYRILHRYLRFDYLVLDEAHELKGADDVAQANAAGALIASSRKVAALTGTLIGGYANHLFPIMMRLAPESLVADGFEWNGFGKFDAKYGKIETTTWTRSGGEDTGRANSHSKGNGRRTASRCRPGIMPQFFGDHLIDKAIFLTLEQVAHDASLAGLLGSLHETIVPNLLDPELAEGYAELQDWLRGVVRQMLRKHDKRLLGTMLAALLGYPDYPYEWGPIVAGDYGSYQPRNLDPSVVRPKERALVDLCLDESRRGRKVWVYTYMTDVRDVGARLAKVLGDAGLRVGYLRSQTPQRSQREAWIFKHAPKLDVVVSHPKLVETGFDLFSRCGNHNFPTLTFYQ